MRRTVHASRVRPRVNLYEIAHMFWNALQMELRNEIKADFSHERTGTAIICDGDSQ